MEHPTGEAQDAALGLAFDRRIKLEFHGSKITSDGGLLAYRELDHVLGLSDIAGVVLADTRTGANGRHALLGQFRQSVFGRWIDTVHARRPVKVIVLDMDSSVSPTYGAQEGSAYNGHFGSTCYHPLFVFNQFGDLERCALRPGNVHSAEGWRQVL